MSIKFCDKHLDLDKWVRAVYKLIFNETWYYIGSSINLKARIGQWKTRLQKGDFNKNASIKFILPKVTSIRFEILELVPDGIWIKEREEYYLNQCFDDNLCLNITPDTVNGKGRKLALGKTPKPPKNKPTPPKPIAQFDNAGNLVAKYKSIGEAARQINVNTDTITGHLGGKKQKTVKGFILKLIAEDGTYLEHGIYKDKIPPGRKFYQLDKNGKIVAEYYNLISAAKALGYPSLTKNISRILNGVYCYKSCKGFTFRYA